MFKVMSLTIGTVLYLSGFILIFPASSAVKRCYDCLGDECLTAEDGRSETCARLDDVCVSWRHRYSNPKSGIIAGTVYRKGCALLLVIPNGCFLDGKYYRCVCRNRENCNDKTLGAGTMPILAAETITTTAATIQPQGRAFTDPNLEQPVKMIKSDSSVRQNFLTSTGRPSSTKPSSSTTFVILGRSMGDEFVIPISLDEPSTPHLSKILLHSTTNSNTNHVKIKTTSAAKTTKSRTITKRTGKGKPTRDPKKAKKGKNKKVIKYHPEIERLMKMFPITTSIYDEY